MKLKSMESGWLLAIRHLPTPKTTKPPACVRYKGANAGVNHGRVYPIPWSNTNLLLIPAADWAGCPASGIFAVKLQGLNSFLFANA